MSQQTLKDRLPTQDEKEKASQASEIIAKALQARGSLPFSVSDDGKSLEVTLPQTIGQLLLELLGHIAKGEMVTFLPYEANLTTQEAADILNVSRPHLTKLLETGEIQFHKVGSHRRVPASELMNYKARRDSQRDEALKELQRLGQEFEKK